MPPQEIITGKKALLTQLWVENPIFRQVLGICSTLAVTNRMFNTLLMCIGLIWATSMSSLTVSLLRNYIPQRVRIMISVLIIAVYVIVVDIAMRVYFPAIHRDIAAYVGLIITNCIVLGRVEAFAIKNPPWSSFCDGLGSGLGYSFILMMVAVVRELLGFGTLFGWDVCSGLLAEHNAQWVIMIMPPGAFFVLAVAIWIFRASDLRKQAAMAAAKEAKK